jgi:Zn-dependent peptidase ImmA (M78 family)
LHVKINPEILKWARQEAGYTIDEMAKRLDIESKRYENWETKREEIPWGKLREISKQYKRQLAVFFLPQIPPNTKRPSDHRNLKLSRAGLSKETLLAIRRARKYLEVSAEIMGRDYWENKYAWIKEDQTTDQLRARLGISIADQQSFRYTSEALRAWRNSIETKLGIFVFQFSLPFNEVQAFCIADTVPFGIVLNSSHTYTGRIFSLFHEIAHITKAQSGICYHDDLDSNQTLELNCNEFAGKLLIPDNIVPVADDLEKLKYHARKLNVSAEVILRRNLERSYISQKRFFELLAEVRQPPKQKKRGGRSSAMTRAQMSRGQLFFNIVIQAVKANKIDFTKASDALGLKINYLMYV